MTIIHIYDPTSDHNHQDVRRIYEFIESIISEVRGKDIIIVHGPGAYENRTVTVERFSIEVTNDRGLRLLEFARRHRLNYAKTLHSISCLELRRFYPNFNLNHTYMEPAVKKSPV